MSLLSLLLFIMINDLLFGERFFYCSGTGLCVSGGGCWVPYRQSGPRSTAGPSPPERSSMLAGSTCNESYTINNKQSKLRAPPSRGAQAPREVFDVGWLHLSAVRPGDESVAGKGLRVDGLKRFRVHRFRVSGVRVEGMEVHTFRVSGLQVSGVGLMSVPQGWGLLRGIGSCPRRRACACLPK